MKLIIAGGGTGGHLFSGLALAEEWLAREHDVFFVGSPQGLENNLVPQYGFALKTIPVSPLKGQGLKGQLKALIKLPVALLKSYQLIKKEQPDLVMGIGGYVSGPMVAAAWLAGIRTAILDQNSVPGLTNRLLGWIAHRIFLTFETSALYFKNKKTKIFGNPVIRKRIPTREQTSWPQKKSDSFKLLVCGGSQGAHAINENFVAAVEHIRKFFPEIEVIHQTGQKDYNEILQKSQELGITYQVAPFFDDMEEIYQTSHLVISRAGAGTLTELSLWGMPAILIPYPYAADDHQLKNAKEFFNLNACEMIDQNTLTPLALSNKIVELLSDEAKMADLSEQILKSAKPEAAKNIIDECMGLGCPSPRA